MCDLLDIARIESGTLNIVRRQHDIGALLLEVLQIYEPMFVSRNIAFTVDMPPQSVEAFFDHDRIVQVLSNLLGNAMKFTPGGGVVALRAERQAKHVVFALHNDGAGISPSALPHIFERFWQLDSNERRGLGLGLSICRAIVSAHGGQIWAESEVGRGAIVSLHVAGPVSTRFAYKSDPDGYVQYVEVGAGNPADTSVAESREQLALACVDASQAPGFRSRACAAFRDSPAPRAERSSARRQACSHSSSMRCPPRQTTIRPSARAHRWGPGWSSPAHSRWPGRMKTRDPAAAAIPASLARSPVAHARARASSTGLFDRASVSSTVRAKHSSSASFSRDSRLDLATQIIRLEGEFEGGVRNGNLLLLHELPDLSPRPAIARAAIP